MMSRASVPRTIALLHHINDLAHSVSELPQPANGGKSKWERDYDRALLQWDRIPADIKQAADVAIKLGMVHTSEKLGAL